MLNVRFNQKKYVYLHKNRMELTELIELFKKKYHAELFASIEFFRDGSGSIIDKDGETVFLFYTIEELIEHLK